MSRDLKAIFRHFEMQASKGMVSIPINTSKLVAIKRDIAKRQKSNKYQALV